MYFTIEPEYASSYSFNSSNEEWCDSYTEFFIFSWLLVFYAEKFFSCRTPVDIYSFFQLLESLTFRLSDLEAKLSKRSRIADGRRCARGMRKLDSMNAQVSHLRKRIETTSSSYMTDEAELQSLISNKKKVIIGFFFKSLIIIIIIIMIVAYTVIFFKYVHVITFQCNIF